MQVRELIQQLKQLPGDAEVEVSVGRDVCPVVAADVTRKPGTVVHESGLATVDLGRVETAVVLHPGHPGGGDHVA